MAAKKDADGADLSARLSRARDIGAKLSEVTDRLTLALRRTESALVAARLGVYGEVRITQEGDTLDSYLCFQKNGNQWRFVIREEADADSFNGPTETPLLSATKLQRVIAAKALPELVDSLVLEAERQLREMSEAEQGVSSISYALAPKGTLAEDQLKAKKDSDPFADDEIPF
jgi:hypothetical protein